MKSKLIVLPAMASALSGLCACRSSNALTEQQAQQRPTAPSASVQPAPIAAPSVARPTQTAPLPVAVANNPAAETEERLGPFVVAGQTYTAVLRKQLPAGAKPGEGLTVVSMQIRDTAGTAQFSRSFANTTQTEGFVDSVSVSVNPLSGTRGSGLLVGYDIYSEPSAPEPEPSSWWQIFGVIDGQLKPFSGPILVQGGLWPEPPRDKPPVPGTPILVNDDTLRFKVWAGRFRLIFPVRIEWSQGKVVPAVACDPKGQPAGTRVCDYEVAPENDRYIPEVTFARVCPDPEKLCEKPERMLVKKDSKVELLATRAAIEWNAGKRTWSGDPKNALDDAGAITIASKEPWLKVRIDGKEGWIHSQEDFDALGMPSEQ